MIARAVLRSSRQVNEGFRLGPDSTVFDSENRKLAPVPVRPVRNVLESSFLTSFLPCWFRVGIQIVFGDEFRPIASIRAPDPSSFT